MKKIDQLNKWPYKSISLNDKKNQKIKNKIGLLCLAFIDILGFKNMVENDIDKVIFALRSFEFYGRHFYQQPRASERHTYFKENYRIDENDNYKPSFTMFSDSIVVSARFDTFFDFQQFLSCLSTIQFELFLEGILLRGGVTVGQGVHAGSYLFGKVVNESYMLENKYALYPRILISKEIINQVDMLKNEQFNDNFNRSIILDGKKYHLNNDFINEDYLFDDHENLVKCDSDDRCFINYLMSNFGIIELSTTYNDYEYLDYLYNDFFESYIVRIKDVINAGMLSSDERVLQKYSWLKSYYNKSINICLALGEHSFRNKWTDRFLV